MEWQPIETAPMQAWDGPVILLRDADGNEAEGSWGWDEEHWDGYTCAWHKGDGLDSLGFEPVEWMPLLPPPNFATPSHAR